MDTSYENGKIYRIIDNTNDNFYVGSTNYVRLCSRLTKHKGSFNAYMNGSSLKYCASMEILINENYKILLLEPYPCKNRDELRMREQEWMDKLRCDKMVNKHNAYVSKEDRREYKKKYREDHKEEINQYRAIYTEEHKEEIMIKSKIYREEHKEEKKIINLNYYHKNKDKRNAKNREKVECPNCKLIVSRGGLTRHKKTKTCLDFVEK
tara:strand:- start:4 stop:627 length:624 start_codon:yes stop_codon:yes gene_type:complete